MAWDNGTDANLCIFADASGPLCFEIEEADNLFISQRLAWPEHRLLCKE